MIEIPTIALSLEWQQPPRKSKRSTQTKSFDFPPDNFRFHFWKSLDQVVQYFDKNLPEQWKMTQKMFKAKIVTKEDFTRLILKCRHCSANIVVKYNKKTQKIQIYKFQNKHRHEIDRKTKATQESIIKQFYKNRPSTETFFQSMKFATQKFSISRNRARYIYAKYAGRATQTIQQIRDRIRKEIGACFQSWADQQGQTTMALMVTKDMIQKYHKFGDCLCFDITYRLVRKYHIYSIERNRHEQQEWGAGFFIGQDCNLRLTLFGVCLIKNQSSQNLEQLFKTFFKIMGNKIPQTIVTDQQGSISKALSDIKAKHGYKWLHLLDWFHKLQNLKRMMIKHKLDRQYRGDLLRAFSKLMREQNPVIFQQLIEQLAEDSRERVFLANFLKDKQRYCTSLIDKKFFGFAVSSARAQAFNNIIKIYIPYSTFPSRFFTQVLRCQKNLNFKMTQVRRFNPDWVHPSLLVGVEKLRQIMEDRVFQKLVENISKVQYLQYQQNVTEGKVTNYRTCVVVDRGYPIKLQYEGSIGFWVCECNYLYHTGIPCSHLLIILRKFKVDISTYVKRRWILRDKDIKIPIQSQKDETQLYITSKKAFKQKLAKIKRGYKDNWKDLIKKIKKYGTVQAYPEKDTIGQENQIQKKPRNIVREKLKPQLLI